jgi:hypothetical protein
MIRPTFIALTLMLLVATSASAQSADDLMKEAKKKGLEGKWAEAVRRQSFLPFSDN